MARRNRAAAQGVEKWVRDRRAWTSGRSPSRKRRRALSGEATEVLVKALNENSHDALPKNTKLKNVVDALQAIWAEVRAPRRIHA